MLKGVILLGVVATIIFLVFLSWRRRKLRLKSYQLPQVTKFLLYNYVPFYRNLSAADKPVFEERMRDFLARTKVTGVDGVIVFDIDLVFIAASAIIPLWGYPKWRYNNLDEILLYPGTFNRHYDTDGPGRNVLGMVGDGTLHRQMLLSQQALRAGFLYPDDAHNTAIHEFVHLIDKADGIIDGVPRYLMDEENAQPWKQYMQLYIQAIKQGYTDINPYGATNEAEFLAVVSEYYFKQPDVFRQQYPELYDILHKMYQPTAAA